MCISIPAKVLRMDKQCAEVEVDGTRRTVLLAEGIKECQWLLIFSGVAIAELTNEEALEMTTLLKAARQ